MTKIKISILDKVAILLFFTLLVMATVSFGNNHNHQKANNIVLDSTSIDGSQAIISTYAFNEKEASF